MKYRQSIMPFIVNGFSEIEKYGLRVENVFINEKIFLEQKKCKEFLSYFDYFDYFAVRSYKFCDLKLDGLNVVREEKACFFTGTIFGAKTYTRNMPGILFEGEDLKAKFEIIDLSFDLETIKNDNKLKFKFIGGVL